MSDTVSPQITDAITNTNVKLVGEAPAMAMGLNYLNAFHASGMMYHNMVNSQHNQLLLAQSSTTQGIIQIYSTDTIANAVAMARFMNNQ